MITGRDLLIIIGIAAGSSLSVALFGALLLRLLRRRTLTYSLIVVALVSVGAVLIGALGTANWMFLSAHDLRVLAIVDLVGGTVGIGSALILGRAVMAGSSALGLAAAGLNQGYEPPGVPLSAELADLNIQLASASLAVQAARRDESAIQASHRQLVAWISHDLRTPLAGIRAMGEALEDEVVTDPVTVRRYHRDIRGEADRLAMMVDDLLELSRINSASAILIRETIALADVVSDAVASVMPLALSKRITLTGAISGNPQVRGSVRELGRVLGNLLVNAIRHTPADAQIRVETRVDDDKAIVEVIDGCGGIPATDLPHVFDVAFRGTTARTPGDGGGGLGLAIAKGLIEAHQGTITLANMAPGCCARISLPVIIGG